MDNEKRKRVRAETIACLILALMTVAVIVTIIVIFAIGGTDSSGAQISSCCNLLRR